MNQTTRTDHKISQKSNLFELFAKISNLSEFSTKIGYIFFSIKFEKIHTNKRNNKMSVTAPTQTLPIGKEPPHVKAGMALDEWKAATKFDSTDWDG